MRRFGMSEVDNFEAFSSEIGGAAYDMRDKEL